MQYVVFSNYVATLPTSKLDQLTFILPDYFSNFSMWRQEKGLVTIPIQSGVHSVKQKLMFYHLKIRHRVSTVQHKSTVSMQF